MGIGHAHFHRLRAAATAGREVIRVSELRGQTLSGWIAAIFSAAIYLARVLAPEGL